MDGTHPPSLIKLVISVMSLANLLMSCVPARQAKVTELSHKIHATDIEQSGAYSLRLRCKMPNISEITCLTHEVIGCTKYSLT